VHDGLPDANTGEPWPGLSSRIVIVGGVAASYAEAVRAAAVLAVSRTSAIAPVLRTAASPFALCDYFGAAAPYMEQARRAPKTGRAGAAGRHVTKTAFLRAISEALQGAREAETLAAMAAFAADERYATAMARDAVELRERARTAGVRSSLRAAVGRAVAACAAQRGLFECDSDTACGTGACQFTAPPYRGVTAVAGPGRFTRPANHVHAGQTFTEASAASQLTVPGAAVPVWDSDAVATGIQAA
jgi:hypothetical protein